MEKRASSGSKRVHSKIMSNLKSEPRMRILSHPLRSNHSEPLKESNKNVIICSPSKKSSKVAPISLKKNYLKQIERKLEETVNSKAKHVKDPSELPVDAQMTFDHKITKQMNFPLEKKIYKQLISLNLSEKEPLLPSSTSFEPMVKDQVPKLENYYCPKFSEEKPIPVSVDLPKNALMKSFDGLRTYRLEKSWKKK